MKYNAFISYSHTDCGNLAPVIQKGLENIGKPWYKIRRNLTIFRDETNLSASPELWNSIIDALDESENLILLASPLAQKSHWINKEIEYWFSKERKGKLFIAKTNGEILWDFSNNDFDWNKTNCLPHTIKQKFKEEPLWIDLQEYIDDKTLDIKKSGFTSSITKIIGGIVGKPPREIESDELMRKRKISIALFLTTITFITIILLGAFFYNQNQKSEKVSISNGLIAEGNKYRETNINKALLLYGYAYDINNDQNTFTILNDFYKLNTTYKLNTYLDYLNRFYHKRVLTANSEKLEINKVLDSLNLISNIKEKKINQNPFYFDANIETQINNLKEQNELDDINFFCSGDRYNFILQDRYLYIYLDKMHEGDGDYYLDYFEVQPLFKLQLLYNDRPKKNNVIMGGEFYSSNEKFIGIYYDENLRKLYVLAHKEQWINDELIPHNELFTFDLFNKTKLIDDKNPIIKIIIDNNGQFDLTAEEKKQLKINLQ